MTDSHSTHMLIETSIARIETYYRYEPNETPEITHHNTTIGESISHYDTKLRCSCGEHFDSRTTAHTHLKENTPRQND